MHIISFLRSLERYLIFKDGEFYCECYFSQLESDGVYTFFDTSGMNCKHHILASRFDENYSIASSIF